MIKNVNMYTVICDNCGKDVNDGEEYSCWNDKKYAESIAIEIYWVKENDEHFCPNCYEYDDDGNLVIKTKGGKHG